MSNNTAELEGLLVGPYLWSSNQYYDFYHEASNLVKGNTQLKNQLNANKASDEVFGTSDFVAMMGVEYWDILKRDEKGKDRYNIDAKAVQKRKVSLLLNLIRDKIEHIREYKEDVKEQLNGLNGREFEFFFKDKDGKYQLNKNQFIAFWIAKFPKLMPYLWLELFSCKDKLEKYYPDDGIDISEFEDSYLDINQYEEKLHKALKCDMENGNVLKRFDGASCSLEFRGFHKLAKILDSNEFIRVAVNSMANVVLSVSHSSTGQNLLEYRGTLPGVDKLMLIITGDITDDKVWKKCIGWDDCRVVVFCKPETLTTENIEKGVEKFKTKNLRKASHFPEFPIQGTELSGQKQDWLFKQSKICVQERYLKLKGIFADSSSLAGVLSGDLLNNLLRKKAVVLFQDYKNPEFGGVYIDRKLSFTYQNEMGGENSIEYFKEGKFLQRIHSKGINKIFFLAESGMGKSMVLKSFGTSLQNSLVIFSSFRNFVDRLKNRVGAEECSKRDIRSVIFDILGCGDDLERYVVSKWLEQKCNNGAEVDLQLDALDEVPSVDFEFALRALEIVQNEFSSVRLWITSSKPFPNQGTFEFIQFSISPFSFPDKQHFFFNYWKPRPGGSEFSNYFGNIEKLLEMCKETSENRGVKDLTDYPLGCSMLAEYYEYKVPESFRSIERTVDVYVYVIKKRFIAMLKYKMAIQLHVGDNVFKLLWVNFFLLHVHFALVHLFPNVSNQFTKPLSAKLLTEENFSKMGIITSGEPIAFTHVSYADFLVAWYIIDVLTTGELDHLCEKEIFDNILCYGSPDKNRESIRFSIWLFVDEFLEEFTDWSGLNWLNNHRKEQHDFVKEKKFTTFLTDCIQNGLWNLARLLNYLWVNDGDMNLCDEVLHLSSSLSETPSWVFTMCHKLNLHDRLMLILCCVQKGQYDLAKYIIDRCSKYCQFTKIADMTESGGGILHCILNQIRKRDDITQPNQFIENTKSFMSFVHGKNYDEIKRKDIHGRSLLQALVAMQKNTQSVITDEHLSSLEKFIVEELGASY